MREENFIRGKHHLKEEKGLSRVLRLEPVNETDIWADLLKGDDAAVSYLYRNYANKLYNYGRQFADHVLVQDCIQDLFFDLIRCRDKLGKVVSIKAYLFSSLRRKIVRKLKRSDKEIREDCLDKVAKFKIAIASDGLTPLDNFSKNRLEVLKTACNSLPARQREAIMLYYFEELSYSEIAEILAMGKVASARILIYRALDSMKKILGGIKNELLVFYLAYLQIN